MQFSSFRYHRSWGEYLRQAENRQKSSKWTLVPTKQKKKKTFRNLTISSSFHMASKDETKGPVFRQFKWIFKTFNIQLFPVFRCSEFGSWLYMDWDRFLNWQYPLWEKSSAKTWCLVYTPFIHHYEKPSAAQPYNRKPPTFHLSTIKYRKSPVIRYHMLFKFRYLGFNCDRFLVSDLLLDSFQETWLTWTIELDVWGLLGTTSCATTSWHCRF